MTQGRPTERARWFFDYYQTHRYCPVCCSPAIRQETGGPLPPPEKGRLVDRNRVRCEVCTWRGVVHDLTPPPPD